MAPKRRVGGRAHSSSSSGIFFSADDQSEAQGNSTLSSSCGNSSNGNGQGSLGLVYGGDVNGAVLNIGGSSGPSVGASSLVTDANSGLSGGGPHLQRSVSINNTESYMRLPASPMSFSSNIRSVSGSPIMDGSSVVQQNQEPNSQQSYQSLQQQQQQQGPLSLSSSQLGQAQLSNNRFQSLYPQNLSYNSQLEKKARIDIKQEDMARQQFLQPFMHRQDPLQLQNTHTQLQAMIQQQRYQRQQEMLQSMPPQQRAQLIEQHQQQLRHQYQQQGVQPPSVMKQSFDSGVCSRRLMQYLYHQRIRHQVPENPLGYWRKFVEMYYAPQAKQRWCFSHYNNNAGHHSPGVFPQVTLDASHCHICGSKSGKGFVATYDALPRLNEIKFGNGLEDELLYLDLPRESRSPSGEMMLEYSKAVLESVYEKVRVVHEGQLRIVFSTELKILSWEFCARRHEEFLPRKLVAPQVNQLLDVVQKCQNTILEKGPNAVALQANSNMCVAAGYQLGRSLDLQSINDLGFSKRYARCLQISEVANGMKDLIDLCSDQKVGPIDALKAFAGHGNGAMSQPQQMQKMYNMLGAGGGSQIIQTNGDEVRLNGLASSQPPYTFENYKNLLAAANRMPMNSDHSTLTQETAAAASTAPPSVNSRNPNQPSSPYNHPPLTPSQQSPNNGSNAAYNLHQPLPPSPLQQSSSNGNGAYNHHQPTPPPPLLQSSNNGMQNSPQAWQQQQNHQETANNGEIGGQQQYADNPKGSANGANGNNGSLLQDNPQAWQQQHHQTSQENGGGQQQLYADDQNGNGVGSNYATETALQNDNPANNAAAENNGLKTDSNGESNVSDLDNGFNQKPVESESQGGMPGETVSERNAELTEDDFLSGDIGDYINFNWDE